jgi:hypothetical protein
MMMIVVVVVVMMMMVVENPNHTIIRIDLHFLILENLIGVELRRKNPSP